MNSRRFVTHWQCFGLGNNNDDACVYLLSPAIADWQIIDVQASDFFLCVLSAHGGVLSQPKGGSLLREVSGIANDLHYYRFNGDKVYRLVHSDLIVKFNEHALSLTASRDKSRILSSSQIFS